MPSDPTRLDQVTAALAGGWAAYREAAARAADEVDGLLREARATTPAEKVPALAASLGVLGARHFDVSRLAPVFGTERDLPAGPALEAIEAAGARLREVAMETGPSVLPLEPGADLGSAVEHELSRIGRGFGAAHVVAVARNGRYERAKHEAWLDGYAFSQWTRRERLLAPPVVVELDGADLKAGGLAALLDGAVRIALVVRDDSAPPAPLVRLLSPGVLAVQSRDGSGLEAVAAASGPAVFAWVPEASAAFVHDPAGGPTLSARLRVSATPAAPRRGLGGQSAVQLAEELRQLEALAGMGAAGTVPAGDSDQPADRLAAWILSQADLGAAAAEAAG